MRVCRLGPQTRKSKLRARLGKSYLARDKSQVAVPGSCGNFSMPPARAWHMFKAYVRVEQPVLMPVGLGAQDLNADPGPSASPAFGGDRFEVQE